MSCVGTMDSRETLMAEVGFYRGAILRALLRVFIEDPCPLGFPNRNRLTVAHLGFAKYCATLLCHSLLGWIHGHGVPQLPASLIKPI